MEQLQLNESANIINKRKRLSHKRFKGYKMNNKQALKLGVLIMLNERESLGFKSTSAKRILESKNPISKTVNDTAKEASNIK
jgi:hypothetical protein